jgi:hypothetical protein
MSARIADVQRSVLHEHRGDRTAALVELRFEHRAGGVPLRVRLQLEDVAHEEHHFEQQLDVLLPLRRHLDRHGLAAPLLGHQIELGQLALDALGVRVRLVDLVDRHDDRHVRRLRVVDRFARLRHHAVVGRDDEDDDVGHLGAAGAHERERFVAGRIEEDDVPAVDRHVVRADVLRDAAGFPFGHARLANRVEQAGLAVIDVAHHGDDRRARHDVLGPRLAGVDEQLLLETAHLHVGAELARDHRRGLGVERGVDRHHQPLHQQLREHVLDTDVELVREVLDRHPFGERDRARDGRRRGRHCRRGRARYVLAALLRPGRALRRTRRLLVRWTRARHAGPRRNARPLRGPGLLRANRLRRQRTRSAHRRRRAWRRIRRTLSWPLRPSARTASRRCRRPDDGAGLAGRGPSRTGGRRHRRPLDFRCGPRHHDARRRR